MTRKRCWEIIPGLLVWLTLILSVTLSFVRPLWMIYFIILFDLYWLLRILYFLPFLLTSWYRYRQALKRNWQAEVEVLPAYDRIRQVIFLPASREQVEVMRETLKVLAGCEYPAERMYVILAGEERYRSTLEPAFTQLVQEFGKVFAAVWTTFHPMDLPGEVVGKGSNLHLAGVNMTPRLLERGLQPD